MTTTIQAPDLAGISFEPPEAPIDESANANNLVEAAFERARAGGKRVLLVLAGNWCPDFRAMAGLFETAPMKDFLAAHYETVLVNIGRYDTNMDIPARYGLPDFEGVPTLMILDADGHMLNADEPSVLRNVRDRAPQEIAGYLAKYAA